MLQPIHRGQQNFIDRKAPQPGKDIKDAGADRVAVKNAANRGARKAEKEANYRGCNGGQAERGRNQHASFVTIFGIFRNKPLNGKPQPGGGKLAGNEIDGENLGERAHGLRPIKTGDSEI